MKRIKTLIYNRINPKYLILLFFVILTFYLVVNFSKLTYSSIELFNSIFSTTLTFSSGLLVFILFWVSKKKNYAIAKALFWLSLSFLSWFIADILWLTIIAIQGNSFPSIADVFYFLMYPFFFISIFKIPSTFSPAQGIKRIFIEISILILTSILFFLSLVIVPGNKNLETDKFSLFIIYLYPVLDIVIIWEALIFFFSNQLKNSKRIMRFYILGIICFTISDFLYYIDSLYGLNDQGNFYDLGYYIFYGIITIGLLSSYHEFSEKNNSKTSKTRTQIDDKWLSFIPSLFLISVICFVLIYVLKLFSISNIFIGIVLIIIFLLFIIHQYIVISENIRLSQEMAHINIELERKVFQRTVELKLANNELQKEIRFRKSTEETLRQSEEKYRLIAENTSDVIWVVNIENFNFTYISPSVENLLGYSVFEVMNKSFLDLFPRESSEIVLNRVNERIEKYYKGFKINNAGIDELQQISKDGSLIWIEMVTTLVSSSSGKLTEIIGVSRNIEQRKKAESQIKHKNIELEELNATKDKLFSIIAHDLRGPFGSVVSSSDILAKNLDSFSKDNVKSFVNAINNSAKITSKLLENMLEWSRLQQGKIRLKSNFYDFRIIVSDVISLNMEAAVKKNIRILNSISDGKFVFCDLELTSIIIQNLLSNAIKFTNSGGQITISLLDKDDHIEVQVLDNGVGIMPEKKPFIFIIDQDVSTLGTENEKGTGLGLIICKELVEKQGGRIWVESDLNQGSTFYFTIPQIKKQLVQ